MKQQQKTESISIIGGGSMGTALAHLLGKMGHPVKLWVFEPEVCANINKNRENNLFLPGFKLPESITATTSLKDAVSEATTVLSVTPSQVLRTVWQQSVQYLCPDTTIVCASKGVETGTGKLMSEVFQEILPPEYKHNLAYLSGPSFAKEIIQGQPTAVVVASENESLATTVQTLLSTDTFRIYTTDDVIGVELGGALKNVMAIAVGMAEGMGLGLNSRSALITRGLAEVTRLAVACGANPLTLAGLAGVGDLVLTCTGHLSRNLQVGMRLGKGETLSEILASMKMVAEGVATAHSTLELAAKQNVEMPIAQTVANILEGQISPKEAVHNLMTRRLRSEKEHL